MLTWFDADPSRYWSVAWGTFAVFIAVAVGPVLAGFRSEKVEQRSLRWLPPWLFIAASSVCFVAFRWPLWFVTYEFNVDESQMLSEALTLLRDPVFWRSVDGATHGPLDVYPLWAVRLVGLNLDYLGARLLGAAMIWLVIIACYRAFASFARESLARVAVVPVFCFFAFTTFSDFVHYSSEHVPLVLVTAGFCLFAGELVHFESRTVRSARWIFAGLLVGGVPMAKLQAVPIAIALLVSATVFECLLPGLTWPNRLKRVLVLAAASLTPTVFFAVISVFWGVGHHAWISYVIQNLEYAGTAHFTQAEMVTTFWSYVRKCENLFPFLIGCIAVGSLSLMPALCASRAALRIVGFAVVFLVSSLVAALAPGRQFFHYLLFIIAPAGLLAGGVWLSSWQAVEPLPRTRVLRAWLLITLFAATLYPQISARVAQPHPYVGSLVPRIALSSQPVAAEILRHAQSGERLGLWGWGGRYHVETQMTQATRDSNSFHQIVNSPLTAYYRTRYLRDFTRQPPPVFVDTVGPSDPSFNHRESQAHETFAEFEAYIENHYKQIAEINGCRIYVRLDRLPQR